MMKSLLQLLFIACTFSLATSQSTLNFQKNIIYNQSGRGISSSMVIADINGDGFNDIITNSTTGGGVAWRKNENGQGAFGNMKEIIRFNLFADNLFVVDLDADGLKDLVYRGEHPITFQSSETRIMWRKNLGGNGNFGEPQLIGTSKFAMTLQVIDADSDGDFDIFYKTINGTSHGLYVTKNSGNGTFEDPTLVVAPSINFNFFVAKINPDGLVDLVTSANAIAYYIQNLNGTFTFTENVGSTSGVGKTLTATDIDGDGDLDIVKLYENGGPSTRRIRWYKNNNNVFANGVDLVPNSPSALYDFSFEFHDLDNDGKKDLVGRATAQDLATNTPQQNAVNEITWYKNLGNETFGTKQIISTAAVQNKTMFVEDINGDGKKDIATNAFSNVFWLNNVSANASSFTANLLDDEIGMPFLAAVADVNSDGKKDVLIASKGNKLSWYQNSDGLGDFSKYENKIITSLQSFNAALLVDANNDGKLDVVACSQTDTNNKIIWLANNGQGGFSNQQVMHTNGLYTLKAVDVDNDGDQDILAYFSFTNSQLTTTELKVFKNNGNGFDAAQTFTYTANTFKSLEPVDMDSDGDLDLMVYLNTSTPASPAGLYWIQNTNGQGNYSTLIPTNLQFVSSKHFVVTDLNQDGFKDLIYTYRTPQGIAYLRMASIQLNGTLGAPVNLFQPVTGGDFGLLKLADLDNDGDLDLLSEFKDGETSGSTNNFFWFENLGNGSIAYRSIFSNIPQVGLFSFLEDMNADGKIDFVLDYSLGSEVFWFKNTGLSLNQIKGKVSLDVATNNCSNASVAAQQVLVTTTKNNVTSSVFTNPSGDYSFKVNAGEYQTEVSTPFPFFNPNPVSISNVFIGNNAESIANFCLVPSQFFNDLEISFYPINEARPGFVAKYLLTVKNKGTNAITTDVNLQYLNQKINFLNSFPNPSSQTANELVFGLNNFLPFANFQAILSFEVSAIPNVTIGEALVFSATTQISNDITPNNNTVNYSQQIVGAYDPNDILVLEGAEVPIANSNEYLHYRVRFQNTGNHYAERVLITIPIDEKLDWKTIEIDGYSHSNTVEIENGNVLKVYFDGIYLPAMVTNEEASNGFIAFKIKPKTTVQVNDTVLKQASIYFDFNPPIITNQENTTFVTTLNTTEKNQDKTIIYPNPVEHLLFIKTAITEFKVEVFNTIGIPVLSENNTAEIDFSRLPYGIYIVRITNTLGVSETFKVVKK